MDSQSSKSRAIRCLMGKFAIKREEIKAIGDNKNDIDMIQLFGHGLAMGNASEEIKKMADEVTVTNDQDGVAAMIGKYF